MERDRTPKTLFAFEELRGQTGDLKALLVVTVNYANKEHDDHHIRVGGKKEIVQRSHFFSSCSRMCSGNFLDFVLSRHRCQEINAAL